MYDIIQTETKKYIHSLEIGGVTDGLRFLEKMISQTWKKGRASDAEVQFGIKLKQQISEKDVFPMYWTMRLSQIDWLKGCGTDVSASEYCSFLSAFDNSEMNGMNFEYHVAVSRTRASGIVIIR